MADTVKRHQDPVTLRVGGAAVAQYVVTPQLDPTLVPRPYLHPVRTLAGTVVTDVLPDDHRWHLGVSLAMPDVSGTNLWGGRTYVRDRGYVPLADHGTIEHVGWRHQAGDLLEHDLLEDDLLEHDLVEHDLVWRDHEGGTLLVERRTLRASGAGGLASGAGGLASGAGGAGGAAGGGWTLTFATSLTNPGREPVELRSPAVNGRGDGAGYGGFFWRLPPLEDAQITAGRFSDEYGVNGSSEPSVTLSALFGGARASLVFSGLGETDRWFVRLAEYPGVGVALAFDRPVVVEPGATMSRRWRVLICDGVVGGR